MQVAAATDYLQRLYNITFFRPKPHPPFAPLLHHPPTDYLQHLSISEDHRNVTPLAPYSISVPSVLHGPEEQRFRRPTGPVNAASCNSTNVLPKASVVMQRLSYLMKTALSNKNRIVLSFKDSSGKPLRRRLQNCSGYLIKSGRGRLIHATFQV